MVFHIETQRRPNPDRCARGEHNDVVIVLWPGLLSQHLPAPGDAFMKSQEALPRIPGMALDPRLHSLYIARGPAPVNLRVGVVPGRMYFRPHRFVLGPKLGILFAKDGRKFAINL